MRLKSVSLVPFLLVASVVITGQPSSSVSAGEGNRTQLMAAGQCGGPYDAGPFTTYELEVEADNSGNLYVANSGDYRVCKIDTSGEISLFAGGNAYSGYPPEEIGDGGLATDAYLFPLGLAADSNGNVFIADQNRVRKVDSQGIISTVAGNGEIGIGGVNGPAIDAQLGLIYGLSIAPNGDLYLLETEGPRILKIDSLGILRHIAGKCFGLGGDGGPAIDAEFAYPNDIALSSTGIVLISDRANKRIRKIDQSGTITTLYGDGNLGPAGCQGFERPDGGTEPLDPTGVAVDSDGNVVVSSSRVFYQNVPNGIVVISPTNNRCFLEVPKPTSVTVDNEGRIVYSLASGDIWRIEDFASECVPEIPVVTTWREAKSPTSFRMAAFELGFSTEVTGLEVNDFVISGTAPGCVVSLDVVPEEYFRKRSVLVSCQGPGTVRLSLARFAVATPNRGSGPLSTLEGPEVSLVNGAVLRVSKAVYRLGESGTVTSNLGGINCGSECVAIVTPGTRVNLTATPGTRNTFLGWAGSCTGTSTCSIVVNGDIDVQAQFFPGELLAVTKTGTGGGSVTSNTGGIVCGSQCSTYVNIEQTTVLSAKAATGSVFVGWFGGGCSGTGQCTIRGGQSVFAVFNRR